VTELRRQLELENLHLREEIELDVAMAMDVGGSPAIRAVLAELEKVAVTEASVLLLGETGVGKELIAERIHDLSPRRGRPLIKVNCAALPPTLMESELFGREKGAYTGAVSREAGRFELADGSTLFLDVAEYVRRQLREDCRPGIVVSIATAGDLVQRHPHGHLLATDGGFSEDGAFHQLGSWDADAVMKLFRQHLLARLVARHAISEELARKLVAWIHPGFSSHIAEAIPFENSKAIEDLACYLVRAPLSLQKLVYLDGQKAVLYRSRVNPSLGRNFEAMDPLGVAGPSRRSHPRAGPTLHPLLRPLRQSRPRRAAG
jgi:hypothetical protein